MDVTVAVIGLPDDLARRLRIALNLQAGFGFKVRHAERVHAGVDLLVADVDAGDGARAVAAAAPGTALLCFGDPARLPRTALGVDRERSISDLKSDLHGLLEATRWRRNGSRAAPAQRPLLVRLAEDSALDRPNLRISDGDIDLLIRRGASRVMARSHSDIITGAERLGLGPWQVEAMDPFDPGAVRGWVSRSLDSFLVRAARARGASLPRFPELPVRLDDWPDLGEINDALALQVSALLVKGTATPESLGEATGAALDSIDALLWAFKAARLLTVSTAGQLNSARPLRQRPEVQPGLLVRLARRFGMGSSAS